MKKYLVRIALLSLSAAHVQADILTDDQVRDFFSRNGGAILEVQTTKQLHPAYATVQFALDEMTKTQVSPDLEAERTHRRYLQDLIGSILGLGKGFGGISTTQVASAAERRAAIFALGGLALNEKIDKKAPVYKRPFSYKTYFVTEAENTGRNPTEQSHLGTCSHVYDLWFSEREEERGSGGAGLSPQHTELLDLINGTRQHDEEEVRDLSSLVHQYHYTSRLENVWIEYIKTELQPFYMNVDEELGGNWFFSCEANNILTWFANFTFSLEFQEALREFTSSTEEEKVREAGKKVFSFLVASRPLREILFRAVPNLRDIYEISPNIEEIISKLAEIQGGLKTPQIIRILEVFLQILNQGKEHLTTMRLSLDSDIKRLSNAEEAALIEVQRKVRDRNNARYQEALAKEKEDRDREEQEKQDRLVARKAEEEAKRRRLVESLKAEEEETVRQKALEAAQQLATQRLAMEREQEQLARAAAAKQAADRERAAQKAAEIEAAVGPLLREMEARIEVLRAKYEGRAIKTMDEEIAALQLYKAGVHVNGIPGYVVLLEFFKFFNNFAHSTTYLDEKMKAQSMLERLAASDALRYALLSKNEERGWTFKYSNDPSRGDLAPECFSDFSRALKEMVGGGSTRCFEETFPLLRDLISKKTYTQYKGSVFVTDENIEKDRQRREANERRYAEARKAKEEAEREQQRASAQGKRDEAAREAAEKMEKILALVRAEWENMNKVVLPALLVDSNIFGTFPPPVVIAYMELYFTDLFIKELNFERYDVVPEAVKTQFLNILMSRDEIRSVLLERVSDTKWKLRNKAYKQIRNLQRTVHADKLGEVVTKTGIMIEADKIVETYSKLSNVQSAMVSFYKALEKCQETVIDGPPVGGDVATGAGGPGGASAAASAAFEITAVITDASAAAN